MGTLLTLSECSVFWVPMLDFRIAVAVPGLASFDFMILEFPRV